MLITFKSAVSGDVMMFGADGKQMLRLLGKDAEAAMGVVTVDQMPAAIAALKQAIINDQANRGGQPKSAAGAGGSSHQKVRLAQRALPLVELLERSLPERAPVTWGV